MPGDRGSVTAIRTTTIRTIQTPSAAPGDGTLSPDPSEYARDFSLEALFDAYFDCRRHKRNTLNQLAFEADLEANLVRLWRELNEGSYEIGRSIAFVIRHPKIREIWAADFRDRVVHHLVYNAIADHFYRRFIRDTYACIPGRGTHDGMRRISSFARSITRNWNRPAYALKIDVANFFNSIDRLLLLEIIERQVPASPVRSLARKIILHDPRPGVIMRSSPELFSAVPPHKSLMRAPENRGLPIGNLTSQFFANVYLNELDQFVKRHLKCRYYGRYVDDMVLLHEDPGVLNEWRSGIDDFLRSELGLHLHPGKIWLNKIEAGINFAGFIIRPGRTYLRRSTVNRCHRKIRAWQRDEKGLEPENLQKIADSLCSYLGMLRQVNGYNSRAAVCRRAESLFLRADEECTKMKTV
jgi:hypothetical protein